MIDDSEKDIFKKLNKKKVRKLNQQTAVLQKI